MCVDEHGMDARKRLRRRAGLHLDRSGEGRDENAAGLRLPPGVDNRTASFADDAPVPSPGFGIDRLADRAEQTQRLAGIALDPLLALALECADGGRRSVGN